jgi:hypothetical protein
MYNYDDSDLSYTILTDIYPGYPKSLFNNNADLQSFSLPIIKFKEKIGFIGSKGKTIEEALSEHNKLDNVAAECFYIIYKKHPDDILLTESFIPNNLFELDI